MKRSKVTDYAALTRQFDIDHIQAHAVLTI